MSKMYTTIQGDMWDAIAKKALGSEYQLDLLMDANPEHRLIVIFPANIKLVIPDAAAPPSLELPPWRR